MVVVAVTNGRNSLHPVGIPGFLSGAKTPISWTGGLRGGPGAKVEGGRKVKPAIGHCLLPIAGFHGQDLPANRPHFPPASVEAKRLRRPRLSLVQ